MIFFSSVGAFPISAGQMTDYQNSKSAVIALTLTGMGLAFFKNPREGIHQRSVRERNEGKAGNYFFWIWLELLTLLLGSSKGQKRQM